MTDERRKKPRPTIALGAVTAVHEKVGRLSRVAQFIGGTLVALPGGAALYVSARKYLAGEAFGAPGWAFFILGAALLLIGLGTAVNGPFWRTATRLANFADNVWGRIRRGRRDV